MLNYETRLMLPLAALDLEAKNWTVGSSYNWMKNLDE